MEYTVQGLAKLAGISTRTLRYYDQIGLLSPKRVENNGYRVYGREEVDALQQILFFKELGLDLTTITQITKDASFNRLEALNNHLAELELHKKQLNLLIQNVKKTIKKEQGELEMKDTEKFEGLKKSLIEKNESAYGKEAREKYGDQTVEDSNKKFSGLTKEQYEAMEKAGLAIIEKLENAVQSKEDYKGEAGRQIAHLHKDWLSYTWSSYSGEAHKGAAQMYTQDERFASYYDKNIPGCAEFLKNSICYHM